MLLFRCGVHCNYMCSTILVTEPNSAEMYAREQRIISHINTKFLHPDQLLRIQVILDEPKRSLSKQTTMSFKCTDDKK